METSIEIDFHVAKCRQRKNAHFHWTCVYKCRTVEIPAFDGSTKSNLILPIAAECGEWQLRWRLAKTNVEIWLPSERARNEINNVFRHFCVSINHFFNLIREPAPEPLHKEPTLLSPANTYNSYEPATATFHMNDKIWKRIWDGRLR